MRKSYKESYRSKYWEERRTRQALEAMIVPVLGINIVTIVALLWMLHHYTWIIV